MNSSDSAVCVGLVITLFNVSITIAIAAIMLNFQEPGIRKASGLMPIDEFMKSQQGCHENLPRSKSRLPDEEQRDPYLEGSRGFLDQSGRFLSHPYVVTGENWDEACDTWNICLSSQTSVDMMFNIAKQANMWEGPMSIAVLAPDLDYSVAIVMIKYLQKCFPRLMSKVAFHITYPRNMPPRYIRNNEVDQSEYNCRQPESVNKEILKNIRTEELSEYIKSAAYPQNLLRNLAREGCPNEFSFTPDIDMISIPGMSRQLDEFVSRNSTRECSKCAYILPIYEIYDTLMTNPETKSDLLKLIEKRYARQFHVKVFYVNQHNSQLKKWQSKPETKDLDVVYNITKYQEFWEPIYVAKATVPFYDERFVGYGFTRNSQIYEMNEAGYSWFMLNNAFLCHSGFQVRRKRSKNRKKQIRFNEHHYGNFKKEIKVRYEKYDEEVQGTPLPQPKKSRKK